MQNFNLLKTVGNGNKFGLYWDRMNSFYGMFRLLGLMPYRIQEEKIVSGRTPILWAMALSVIQVSLMVLGDKMQIESPDNWDTYDNTLAHIVRFLFGNSVFMFIATWTELPRTLRYISDWQAFTESLQTEAKVTVKCITRGKVRRIVVFIALLSLSAVCTDQFLQNSRSVLIFLYHLFPVFIGTLYTAFWITNCVFIVQLARSYKCNLQLVLSVETDLKPVTVYAYRQLWLQLNRSATNLPNALQYSLTLVILLNHSATIVSSFTWTNAMFNIIDVHTKFRRLVPFAWSFVTLMCVCESSHWVSQEVGHHILVKVLSVKGQLKFSDTTVKELGMLLEAMETNSSDLEVGGLITLNRRLILTLLSVTLTYVIVLMQFDINVIK